MKWLVVFAGLALLTANIRAKIGTNDKGKPPYLKSVPKTSFTCENRPGGYYADTEANCQSYHMCDGNRQYSFLCPHLTFFHQKYMVCDHYAYVKCEQSENYYNLNLEIGKVETPVKISKNPKKVPSTQKKLNLSSQSRLVMKNQRNLHAKPIFKNVEYVPSKETETTESTEEAENTTIEPDHLEMEDVSFTGGPKVFSLKESNKNISSKVFFNSKNSKKVKVILSKPDKKFRDSMNFHQHLHTKKHNLLIHGRGGGGGEGKLSFKNAMKRKDIRKFNPILNRPKNQSSAIANVVLPETHFTGSIDEGDQFFSLPILNFSLISNLTRFVPFKNKLENADLFISRNLVPPVKEGPISLVEHHQELQTPLLTINAKTKPMRDGRSEQISMQRGNPHFFIMEPGLIPPGNSLENEDEEPENSPMTMTFSDKRRNKYSSKINKKCPKCHPTFLKPNKCHPCVIIR